MELVPILGSSEKGRNVSIDNFILHKIGTHESSLAAPQSELATTYRQTYKPEGNNTAGGPLKASFSPVMMDEELVFQDVSCVMSRRAICG